MVADILKIKTNVPPGIHWTRRIMNRSAFWLYLISALQTVESGVGNGPLEMLRSAALSKFIYFKKVG